jgi:hypothetical protein
MKSADNTFDKHRLALILLANGRNGLSLFSEASERISYGAIRLECPILLDADLQFFECLQVYRDKNLSQQSQQLKS